jgi:alginate O-acetyltransferase complex protein AlgI
MLFSTGCFIYLFLPISLMGYQLLSRCGRTALLGWLAAISLFFYGAWSPPYLLLLLASITINFLFSLQLAPTRSDRLRSFWLATAITVNILLLMWFKYLFPVMDFLFRHGLTRHSFGSIMLPLGISFFTFTQIAYLIDLRQGLAKNQGLLSYTVFVTFFPHLIAGPIIHPREIMPQLEERLGPLRLKDLQLGFSWFVLGLAKKVLIADFVARQANELYARPEHFGAIGSWVGAISYAMQLYFDFSGYSDMAVGLARMFSIDFPLNFDSPYKAPSIIEFWQHWHMTLSRYLGEYLYTPILRRVVGWRIDHGRKVNRRGQATFEGYVQMVFYPTMVTMFLAGIWHGAGLQYIVFGLLHGTYLVINHAWRIFSPKEWNIPTALSVLVTFSSVLVSLVFFRSNDVHQAFYILKSMAGLHGRHAESLHSFATRLAVIGGCFFLVMATPNTQQILGQADQHDSKPFPSLFASMRWQPTLSWSFGLTLLLCVSILMLDSSTSFLYFQF